VRAFTQQLKRRQIDQVLDAARSLQHSLMTRSGWIREIRKALGMTGAQLAHRMQVTPAAVAQFEKREREGTITLESLRKCAHAMDCELIYVFLPRTTLTQMVDQRIQAHARRSIESVDRTMGLEGQATRKQYRKEQLAQLVAEYEEIPPRDLWDSADAEAR